MQDLAGKNGVVVGGGRAARHPEVHGGPEEVLIFLSGAVAMASRDAVAMIYHRTGREHVASPGRD